MKVIIFGYGALAELLKPIYWIEKMSYRSLILKSFRTASAALFMWATPANSGAEVSPSQPAPSPEHAVTINPAALPFATSVAPVAHQTRFVGTTMIPLPIPRPHNLAKISHQKTTKTAVIQKKTIPAKAPSLTVSRPIAPVAAPTPTNPAFALPSFASVSSNAANFIANGHFSVELSASIGIVPPFGKTSAAPVIAAEGDLEYGNNNGAILVGGGYSKTLAPIIETVSIANQISTAFAGLPTTYPLPASAANYMQQATSAAASLENAQPSAKALLGYNTNGGITVAVPSATLTTLNTQTVQLQNLATALAAANATGNPTANLLRQQLATGIASMSGEIIQIASQVSQPVTAAGNTISAIQVAQYITAINNASGVLSQLPVNSTVQNQLTGINASLAALQAGINTVGTAVNTANAPTVALQNTANNLTSIAQILGSSQSTPQQITAAITSFNQQIANAKTQINNITLPISLTSTQIAALGLIANGTLSTQITNLAASLKNGIPTNFNALQAAALSQFGNPVVKISAQESHAIIGGSFNALGWWGKSGIEITTGLIVGAGNLNISYVTPSVVYGGYGGLVPTLVGQSNWASQAYGIIGNKTAITVKPFQLAKEYLKWDVPEVFNGWDVGFTFSNEFTFWKSIGTLKPNLPKSTFFDEMTFQLGATIPLYQVPKPSL